MERRGCMLLEGMPKPRGSWDPPGRKDRCGESVPLSCRVQGEGGEADGLGLSVLPQWGPEEARGVKAVGPQASCWSCSGGRAAGWTGRGSMRAGQRAWGPPHRHEKAVPVGSGQERQRGVHDPTPGWEVMRERGAHPTLRWRHWGAGGPGGQDRQGRGRRRYRVGAVETGAWLAQPAG